VAQYKPAGTRCLFSGGGTSCITASDERQSESVRPTDSLGRYAEQLGTYGANALTSFGVIYALPILASFWFVRRMRTRQRRWMLGLLAVYLCSERRARPERQARQLHAMRAEMIRFKSVAYRLYIRCKPVTRPLHIRFPSVVLLVSPAAGRPQCSPSHPREPRLGALPLSGASDSDEARDPPGAGETISAPIQLRLRGSLVY
jgi:hypothetical protein